jgi:UDP-N-acetylglucosamine 1-carboxyvinyltransferase
MASFEITGGTKLRGEITPQGAKNEALQILCAVLISPEPIVIHNVPNIIDVNKLIELLNDMGVMVTKITSSTYRFESKDINLDFLDTEEFKKKASALRGSIMIIGPLLARFGKAKMPKPGGDKIGRRRLDTHFIGLQKLGASFDYDSNDSFYNIHAAELKGCYMLLDEASVTGTANVVLAAVMAKGETTIYNAACEPYLQQLCAMLNRMGAKISGIGSNLLKIQGVDYLGGTEHTILPDMIEIGSFIGLAAMTGSEITIKNCRIDMLGLIPSVFQRLGIKLEFRGDDIFVPEQEYYEIDTFIDGSILTVADQIWPGFTPDLLSIVLVVATQARGSVLIHQKILCDPHRATVIGLGKQVALRGISMSSPDIRAGVSLLIAAMSAHGKSTIHNIEQIDRGYQNIDERLNALGAKIKRSN